MENLSPVDKNESFKILSRISDQFIDVHFMQQGSQQIYKCMLAKNQARRIFYLDHPVLEHADRHLLTFKIVFEQKLFFLKTYVKRGAQHFFFDNLNDMYELVRRKKPRYAIPSDWSQTAKLHKLGVAAALKSPAEVIDLSKSGIRLRVKADIPRYYKDDEVTVSFKIYRRGEIDVKCKVIYVQTSAGGERPHLVGLKFLDSSILLSNKIQNVCDDLALYWTNAYANHNQS